MDISPRDALLQVVREAFGRKGTWPRRQHVEAALDQDYGFDLEDALTVRPHTLVRADGIGAGSEVILTVAGLAAAGAEHEVDLFIESLRWCVDTVLGFRPSDPDVTEEVKLESGEFKSEWKAKGVEIDDIDLAKLHAMFLTEGVYGGMSGGGATWTITLECSPFAWHARTRGGPPPDRRRAGRPRDLRLGDERPQARRERCRSGRTPRWPLVA
jgi:hypothetical protein